MQAVSLPILRPGPLTPVPAHRNHQSAHTAHVRHAAPANRRGVSTAAARKNRRLADDGQLLSEHSASLHTLAANANAHFYQRAQKQGWSQGSLPGNAPWLEAAQGATQALRACVSNSKWSLGVRDVAKLATTASKLAKACRGKARAGTPGTASISELVAAIATYVMCAPAFEAADPSSWCVLLHGLVSASQALPGNPAHPQLVTLAAHASSCMHASCSPHSWNPAHNPSLRPQTLSSLLWVFAVLGFKASAAQPPSRARSVAGFPGSVGSGGAAQTEGTGAPKVAAAVQGEGVRKVAGMQESLVQLLAGVLQSVRLGGMRTGKAREWVLLLWALAKVGAPAREVEATLHEAGVEAAICAPMAAGLCNAQDISNTIWAVAEGRYASLQAPVLQAAATGLQVRNVLLDAGPSPNQSLQAASNTVWGVQQVLSRSELARAAADPPSPPTGMSGEMSDSREHAENIGVTSMRTAQQKAALAVATAELQEAGLQVTAHCVHALKHHLARCYGLDEQGLGRSMGASAPAPGQSQSCAHAAAPALGHAQSHSHAAAPAPAAAPAAPAAAAPPPPPPSAPAPATATAPGHAHDSPEAIPPEPASLAAAAHAHEHAATHKRKMAVPPPRPSVSHSVRAGWSNSASMSASALASLGVYDEQLFGLVVGVVLQGAVREDEWGHKQTEGRHMQQGVGRGGVASDAQGHSTERQVPHPTHRQQQQQQQQRRQQQRQKQQGGSRGAATDVASTLWACARVGHGLHGAEGELRHSGAGGLQGVSASSVGVQGMGGEGEAGGELLGGSGQRCGESSRDGGEGGSTVQVEGDGESLKQLGLTETKPGDPTTTRQHQQLGHELQGQLSSDLLALFKQYARREGLPSHTTLTSSSTATTDSSAAVCAPGGVADAAHSARSITMALFALAVLCPVLAAEQQQQDQQQGQQQQQQVECSRHGHAAGSCAGDVAHSRTGAAGQGASTGVGQQTVDSDSAEDGGLASAALVLFRAAAARPPSQFGVHGLTQLHMAYMEVTESGLLSTEQLAAAGWHPGLPSIHSPSEPAELQAPASELASTAVVAGGPVGLGPASGDESVASAAAKAWQAGQGAGAQLSYAEPGGWEQAYSTGQSVGSSTAREVASGDAPDQPVSTRQLRLHVSRSQHEVLQALQRMGCTGMQVEGSTDDGAMRVDILLPQVQLSVLEPYLLATPHAGSGQDQMKGTGTCPPTPAAFGPVALEFNGPDHYLLMPAGVPDGPTMLRGRALLRRVQAVVSVPWWDWASMEGQDEVKEQYLAQRLYECLLHNARRGRGRL